jgi:peptidoglycan/LPS O-acetylase OafA/YrhL
MAAVQEGSGLIHYRPDIDGLRAIAVLLVLVFHFDLVAGGNAGFIGVDIFFVISGFLITSIIKRQLDENTFSVKAFYLNRVRRLAPALFAVLMLVMLAGLVWLLPTELEELSKEAFLAQLYVVNFYYWQNINYFGLNASHVFLLHTWSLAVEEQFYLVYPLVVLLLHRYLKHYFWAALALGCALSFSLSILLIEHKPQATFYLLPTRAWELLAGGLIPFLDTRLKLSARANKLTGLLGLGAILAGVLFFSESVRFPGFFALAPTLGGVCLILSGAGGATPATRLLSLPPLVYIGKISYSLYLVHWPINVFAAILLGEDHSYLWRLGMFCFSVALSAGIYHTIENPFRRRRLLGTSRQLTQGYLAGIAATVVIFLSVHGTGGLPKRYPSDVVRIAGHVNDKTSPLTECRFTGNPVLTKENFCRIGIPNKAPKWLVYGDSHAWAAHAVFEKWLNLKDEAGLFMYLHACPPLNGIHMFRDRGNCFAFNKAISSFLAKEHEISDVAIVSTWRQAAEGGLSTSPDKKLSKDESIRLFEKKFSATMEYLHALQKQVLVWGPVPGARRNVPLALARATISGRPANVEITRDEYFSTCEFFFRALRTNRHLIAHSFSPAKALCEPDRCAVTVDGRPVYFDTNHLTKSSADFWVKAMEAQYHHQPSLNPGGFSREVR